MGPGANDILLGGGSLGRPDGTATARLGRLRRLFLGIVGDGGKADRGGQSLHAGTQAVVGGRSRFHGRLDAARTATTARRFGHGRLALDGRSRLDRLRRFDTTLLLLAPVLLLTAVLLLAPALLLLALDVGVLTIGSARLAIARLLGTLAIEARTGDLAARLPVAVVAALGPLGTLLATAIVPPLGTRLGHAIVTPVRALLAATIGLLRHHLLAGPDRIALVGEIFVALELAELVAERIGGLGTALLRLLALRLFLPGASLAQDAEIMVGELEIIFGVDPVALALRVGGEVLVLFEQLGRIAARAIVDAIAVVGATAAAATLRPLAIAATAATPPAGLPIVYQARLPRAKAWAPYRRRYPDPPIVAAPPSPAPRRGPSPQASEPVLNS